MKTTKTLKQHLGYSYQVIKVTVFTKEGLALFLLTVYEVLNVHIKTGRRYGIGTLSGLLTLLKQQSQKREKWMSGIKKKKQDRIFVQAHLTHPTPWICRIYKMTKIILPINRGFVSIHLCLLFRGCRGV